MWFIFLIIALVVLAIILTILLIIIYHRQYWRFRDIPHESPAQFFDLVKAIKKHVGTTEYEIEQEHYRQLYIRFKDTGVPFCGFYHLLQPRVLVLDRELVKQILVKDFSNFNSRGVYYNCRNDPLSADLWSRSGNSWREMRLKNEPIFHKNLMPNLYECIEIECEEFLKNVALSVEREAQHDCYIDIKRLIRNYILSTIASCVFGINTPALKLKYPIKEFEAATELALHTQRHDVVLNFMLTRYYRLARKLGFSSTNSKAAEYFIRLIDDVVTQREKLLNTAATLPPKTDYLQLLVDIKTQELATHETDEDFDAKQLNEHLSHELISNAIGFLKIGFEPTVNTLAFVLNELAMHEWAQDKAREEVLETLEKHNNVYSYECLMELKFMGQVISETIRLNPIVPFLIRRTLNDYHVSNQPKYHIHKDMYVIIPTYAMHNDPMNFPEPQQFQPQRFSKLENKNREQCLWLGFGDGPRSCIGIQFAQLQIRAALARLLMAYKFRLSPTRITIKYQHGMFLHIKPLSMPIVQSTEITEATETRTEILENLEITNGTESKTLI